METIAEMIAFLKENDCKDPIEPQFQTNVIDLSYNNREIFDDLDLYYYFTNGPYKTIEEFVLDLTVHLNEVQRILLSQNKINIKFSFHEGIVYAKYDSLESEKEYHKKLFTLVQKTKGKKTKEQKVIKDLLKKGYIIKEPDLTSKD